MTRDAHALDNYVEQLVVERLSRPGTIEELTQRDDTADVAALRVEQVALGERKDKAAAMFAKGGIDEVQLVTITRELDERAAQIAEVLAKVGWRSPLEPLVDSAGVAARWQHLSLAQKRAILAAVCEVTVLPTRPTTRGFDPAGVRIDWKDR